MIPSLLADASGVLGAVLVIAAFFLKNPRQILAVSFISSTFWIIHFGLIAAWAGVIVSIASAVRNFAGAYLPRKSMITLTWVAVAFTLTFGIMIDKSGFVVLLAAPARAIGNHLRDKEIPFRFACAASACCYIVYGISINSPLAISSTVALAVILGTPLFRKIRKTAPAQEG